MWLMPVGTSRGSCTKELNPSRRPVRRKRAASRLPAFVPASTTLTPSTMSITPPQNPIDLTSPITSPIPKRTKTSHNSDNDKMIQATTSEPNNVPVPVTKVQDGPHLLIKKLSDKAKLPTRGSAFAAGYDLYAAKETTIPARGKGLVDTDLSMAVPAGTCKCCALHHHSVSLLTLPIDANRSEERRVGKECPV